MEGTKVGLLTGFTNVENDSKKNRLDCNLHLDHLGAGGRAQTRRIDTASIRRTRNSTVALALAVLVIGCESDKGVRNVTPPTLVEDAGWQPFPTPRDGDPPGTVYRIDGQGVRWDVDNVNDKVAIPATNEAFGAYHRKMTGSSILSFLLGDIFSADASFSSSADFSLNMGDGLAVHESSYEDKIDDALRGIARKLDPRKDGRYYIIRETLSSTELHATSTTDAATKIKSEASWKKVLAQAGAKASIDFSKDNGTQFTLDRAFGKQMRVFYKAQVITVTPGATIESIGFDRADAVLEPYVDHRDENGKSVWRRP